MRKITIVLLFLLLLISPFYSQNSDLNIIVNRKSDIQKAQDFTSVSFYLKDIEANQVAKLVEEVTSYSGMVIFTMNEMGQNMNLYRGYLKFSSSIDFIGLEKIFVFYNIKTYTVEGEKKQLGDLNKRKITEKGKVSQ